jgi:hypothetical protein
LDEKQIFAIYKNIKISFMKNPFESLNLNQPKKTERGAVENRGSLAAEKWKQRVIVGLATTAGFALGGILSNPAEALAAQKTEQTQNQVVNVSDFQSSQTFPNQELLAQAKTQSESLEIFSSDVEYKILMPYVQKGADRLLFSVDGKTVTFFRGRQDLGTIPTGVLGFVRDKGQDSLIINGVKVQTDQQLYD